MELWHDARGQATSEYAALVLLVAVVLALAAGLTSGGVGGQVLAGIQRGICRVTGTICPPPEPPRPDLAPCPVERTTRRESLDGAFDVVRLGKSGTLTAVRTSDGRVTVTLADGATVGAGLVLGFGLGAEGDHELEARAGVSARVEAGRSWTFPNEPAAHAFIDRYGSKATIGGQAVDALRSGCSILCDAVGWRPHAELPPPDEQYMGAGATAKFKASAGPAALDMSAEALLGTRQRRDGSTTWFLRLDAGAALDVALGPDRVSPNAQGQAVVSYVLDPHGRPTQLVIHAVARGGAGVAAHAVGHSGHLSGGGRGQRVAELDATLDLRDPQNAAAAKAFLSALRDPLATRRLERSAAAVRARIAETGAVDRRTYALSSSRFELGAEGGVGVQLGADFEHSSEDMHLLSAETRLPGLPFLPRDDCRNA
ncbi:MAG TPA: hypothetical protein VN635_09620 [Conexibacter sp.]|nr:hypothetical protein [Conexibacter sp.]